MGPSRRVLRPHGSWSSPLSAERLTAGSLRLSQPRLHGDEVVWLEGRPAQGGRQVVMAAAADGGLRELSPAGVSVRTRVHEYGGGDYAVGAGRLFFSRDDDQKVYACDLGGGPARALSDGSARHADFALSPDARWLVAVEERARGAGEPENRLVALPTAGGAAREVASGFDFVSFPRFSPDGERLAFTAWRHPHMPWDESELWEVAWSASGPGERRRVAGGVGESIFQPGYSPAGVLTFASDRSGWWNLEQLRDGRRVPLCPRAAEFGRAQWVFGLSTWGYLDEGTLLCAVGEGGRQRLARLRLADGSLRSLLPELDVIDGLSVAGGRAALLGASSTRAPAVGLYDPARDAFRPLRAAFATDLGDEWLARPESLDFPTGQGERAHAFLYRPVNPECEASPGTAPPLLVRSHGGPTAACSSALDLSLQFFAQRGFALLDVNYRGSTGFGRAYRDRLRGGWGVVDVEDCVQAARFAAAEGVADPDRLAIRGGSAGGFTTLCALTFHDVFRAGASYYGIGDLEALARDTHKFESRYLEGLVGPWPARRDLYRARSPIHHAQGLSCPVIFLQGLEDRVVPPSQSEAMAAALAARGIAHAYVGFAGEQHGFRRAASQRTALEAELWFYGQVLGFPGAPAPEGVALVPDRRGDRGTRTR